MVSNATRLSALLFAHVFEKYVGFVEKGHSLGPPLANVFLEFRNRRILRTRMQNVNDMAAESLHVFEKYDEFAARTRVLCTRVREIRRLSRRSGRAGCMAG